MGGMGEAVELARELVAEHGAYMPQQFSNPANPEIHRRPRPRRSGATSTARSTCFVAGVGTGGTITGVGQVLKERQPALQVIASSRPPRPCSPAAPGPHKIQGIGAGFVPEVLDRSVIDEVIAVDDEDALETARAGARREGLLVGISAGAAIGRARGRRARRRCPASGSS